VIAREPAPATQAEANPVVDGALARGLELARTFGAPGLAVVYLAHKTIATVLAKVGHAGATLDDAYIHFQYARAIAEGHPMRFAAGEPITSGSTSLLWPLVLAPFWALGARDEGIVWVAWFFAFAALFGLAWEASRLTERLAGKTAAFGAGAMTLAFGGSLWCAASGMEVVPFAWALAATVRRAAEWAERDPSERTRRHAGALAAMAWVAALLRPEGAAVALFVAATFAVYPGPTTRGARPAGGLRSWMLARAWSTSGVAAAFAAPAFLWLVTGSARSTTAVAKLLPGNPYYAGAALQALVLEQAKILVTKILNGEAWSAEFLPRGGASIAMMGLGAVVLLGSRTRRPWRAAGVLLLALLMFAPCFYLTFLWNRLRYLWPFATGWIIGVACLARLAGDALALLRPRFRAATGIACGIVAGLFASKLDWVIDDVAQSASGIDRQQVALGRWARANLPASARIGVNDTGAIAYFGRRTTFDIVGLTTASEARYWVGGAASRFEHYERLYRSAPQALPTHFIVYPEWMALPAVLGEPLHDATVTDSSILGGQTMRVFVADWSRLGSGELPWTRPFDPGAIIDALDVADLDSEAEHEYELLGAHDGEEVVREGISPKDGMPVFDGGRTHRTRERFVVRLPAGTAVHGLVRLDGPEGTLVRVLANDQPIATIEVTGDSAFEERPFVIPADVATSRTRIELRATDGDAVTVFHYWFY
jgi:hypothetical protein